MNLYEYQRSRSFIDLGPVSHRFTFLNFFSLETALQIEATFHVKTPWDRGMKVCSNGLGHITNMAAMPIYDNNLKKNLLWHQTADDLKGWYAASGIQVLPSLFK